MRTWRTTEHEEARPEHPERAQPQQHPGTIDRTLCVGVSYPREAWRAMDAGSSAAETLPHAHDT